MAACEPASPFASSCAVLPGVQPYSCGRRLSTRAVYSLRRDADAGNALTVTNRQRRCQGLCRCRDAAIIAKLLFPAAGHAEACGNSRKPPTLAMPGAVPAHGDAFIATSWGDNGIRQRRCQGLCRCRQDSVIAKPPSRQRVMQKLSAASLLLPWHTERTNFWGWRWQRRWWKAGGSAHIPHRLVVK